MRFLRDLIFFLSPRSAFASAIATRVAARESLKSPFELDEVPLARGTGESFSIVSYPGLNGRHSSFMRSKSRVTDGPVGGVVFPLSTRRFFLGIREDLLVSVANQSFDQIVSYASQVGSSLKTVECTFSAGRFRTLDLPSSIVKSVEKKGNYVYFRLKGTLHYGSHGFVFGVLPVRRE